MILSLALPNPAFALRQVGLEESDETRREVVAQLTNQPQIDEPQLRGHNAYAQALRALTYGAKVTPASRVRLRALREIGPGIEKTVRKLLQNQEIKIAVGPRGSSLRGYAADQSDVEYNVYILSGLGSNQTIDVEMQQQIHAAVDAFLEGRDLQADGYKFTEIENFSGILQGEILSYSFAPESEQAKQLIGEYAGTLFLPVAYGDVELIEKSRRSFLESITPQNIKWQKSVWKLAQHSYLSDAVVTEEELNIKSRVKLHFRTWLSDHGVNPTSTSAVQKFLQRHRKLVGLPSLEDMKRIYLIGSQLQNSAAGLEEAPYSRERVLELSNLIREYLDTGGGEIGQAIRDQRPHKVEDLHTLGKLIEWATSADATPTSPALQREIPMIVEQFQHLLELYGRAAAAVPYDRLVIIIGYLAQLAKPQTSRTPSFVQTLAEIELRWKANPTPAASVEAAELFLQALYDGEAWVLTDEHLGDLQGLLFQGIRLAKRTGDAKASGKIYQGLSALRQWRRRTAGLEEVKRILLLVESPGNREMFVNIIKDIRPHNIQLIVPENIEEARDFLSTESPRPDAVLMDLDSSEKRLYDQGLNLIRWVRSSERTRNLPMAFFSGRSDVPFRERLQELDVTYIEKPLGVPDVEKILTAFGIPRVTDSASPQAGLEELSRLAELLKAKPMGYQISSRSVSAMARRLNVSPPAIVGVLGEADYEKNYDYDRVQEDWFWTHQTGEITIGALQDRYVDALLDSPRLAKILGRAADRRAILQALYLLDFRQLEALYLHVIDQALPSTIGERLFTRADRARNMVYKIITQIRSSITRLERTHELMPLVSGQSPPTTSQAGAEETLEQMAQRIRANGQKRGLTLIPIWRGIGRDGLPAQDEPVILSLGWRPPDAVDGQQVATYLKGQLKDLLARTGADVSFGKQYVTVALPQKSWGMRQELERLRGKGLVIVFGDSATVDFFGEEDLRRNPLPEDVDLVQVLVQGSEAVAPAGYPNVVRAALGPEETFDEKHAGIDIADANQRMAVMRRRDRIVGLAGQGAHIRFITNKTAQEISAERRRNDEERILKPLAVIFEAKSIPLDRVALGGANGVQWGRAAGGGLVRWERADLPSQRQAFSVKEALEIYQAKQAAVLRAIRTAGMEEQGKTVNGEGLRVRMKERAEEPSGRGVLGDETFGRGTLTPPLQRSIYRPPNSRTKYLPSATLLSALTQPQSRPQDTGIQDNSRGERLGPKHLVPNERSQDQPSEHNRPRIREEPNQGRLLSTGESHLKQVYQSPADPSKLTGPRVTTPQAGLEEVSVRWSSGIRKSLRPTLTDVLAQWELGSSVFVDVDAQSAYPSLRASGRGVMLLITLTSAAVQSVEDARQELQRLLVARWAYERLLPALQILINTGLRDLSELRALAGTLPESDRSSWRALIEELDEHVARARATPPADAQPAWAEAPPLSQIQTELFLRIWWSLNTRWLAARQVLLYPRSEWVNPAELAQTMVAGTIQEQRSVSFGGEATPIYFGRALIPPRDGSRPEETAVATFVSGVWYAVGGILMHDDNLEWIAQNQWNYFQLSELSETDCRQRGLRHSVIKTLVQLNQVLRRRYGDRPRFFRAMREERLIEEIGHGHDHRLVERQAGRRFPLKDNAYRTQFVETHVSAGGFLHALWDQPERVPPELMGGRDVKMYLADSFAELASYLRRAALGSDPTITLLNWLSLFMRTQRGVLSDPHATATALAIRLLADELAMTDESQRLVANTPWFLTGPDSFAALVDQLAQRPTEELRLALKAVFAREFTHPVDEAPFAEIRADGTLAARELGTGEQVPVTGRTGSPASGLSADISGGEEASGLEEVVAWRRALEKAVPKLKGNLSTAAVGSLRNRALDKSPLSSQDVRSILGEKLITKQGITPGELELVVQAVARLAKQQGWENKPASEFKPPATSPEVIEAVQRLALHYYDLLAVMLQQRDAAVAKTLALDRLDQLISSVQKTLGQIELALDARQVQQLISHLQGVKETTLHSEKRSDWENQIVDLDEVLNPHLFLPYGGVWVFLKIEDGRQELFIGPPLLWGRLQLRPEYEILLIVWPRGFGTAYSPVKRLLVIDKEDTQRTIAQGMEFWRDGGGTLMPEHEFSRHVLRGTFYEELGHAVDGLLWDEAGETAIQSMVVPGSPLAEFMRRDPPSDAENDLFEVASYFRKLILANSEKAVMDALAVVMNAARAPFEHRHHWAGRFVEAQLMELQQVDAASRDAAAVLGRRIATMGLATTRLRVKELMARNLRLSTDGGVLPRLNGDGTRLIEHPVASQVLQEIYRVFGVQPVAQAGLEEEPAVVEEGGTQFHGRIEQLRKANPHRWNGKETMVGLRKILFSRNLPIPGLRISHGRSEEGRDALITMEGTPNRFLYLFLHKTAQEDYLYLTDDTGEWVEIPFQGRDALGLAHLPQWRRFALDGLTVGFNAQWRQNPADLWNGAAARFLLGTQERSGSVQLTLGYGGGYQLPATVAEHIKLLRVSKSHWPIVALMVGLPDDPGTGVPVPREWCMIGKVGAQWFLQWVDPDGVLSREIIPSQWGGLMKSELFRRILQQAARFPHEQEISAALRYLEHFGTKHLVQSRSMNLWRRSLGLSHSYYSEGSQRGTMGTMWVYRERLAEDLLPGELAALVYQDPFTQERHALVFQAAVDKPSLPIEPFDILILNSGERLSPKTFRPEAPLKKPIARLSLIRTKAFREFHARTTRWLRMSTFAPLRRGYHNFIVGSCHFVIKPEENLVVLRLLSQGILWGGARNEVMFFRESAETAQMLGFLEQQKWTIPVGVYERLRQSALFAIRRKGPPQSDEFEIFYQGQAQPAAITLKAESSRTTFNLNTLFHEDSLQDRLRVPSAVQKVFSPPSPHGRTSMRWRRFYVAAPTRADPDRWWIVHAGSPSALQLDLNRAEGAAHVLQNLQRWARRQEQAGRRKEILERPLPSLDQIRVGTTIVRHKKWGDGKILAIHQTEVAGGPPLAEWVEAEFPEIGVKNVHLGFGSVELLPDNSPHGSQAGLEERKKTDSVQPHTGPWQDLLKQYLSQVGQEKIGVPVSKVVDHLWEHASRHPPAEIEVLNAAKELGWIELDKVPWFFKGVSPATTQIKEQPKALIEALKQIKEITILDEDTLWQSLLSLRPNRFGVLYYRYVERKSFDEIGKLMGRTRERMRHLLYHALSYKLKRANAIWFHLDDQRKIMTPWRRAASPAAGAEERGELTERKQKLVAQLLKGVQALHQEQGLPVVEQAALPDVMEALPLLARGDEEGLNALIASWLPEKERREVSDEDQDPIHILTLQLKLAKGHLQELKHQEGPDTELIAVLTISRSILQAAIVSLLVDRWTNFVGLDLLERAAQEKPERLYQLFAALTPNLEGESALNRGVFPWENFQLARMNGELPREVLERVFLEDPSKMLEVLQPNFSFTQWRQSAAGLEEQQHAVQKQIRTMAAWHLLSALGLQDPQHIPGAEEIPFRVRSGKTPSALPDGLTVKRIRIPPRSDPAQIPQGLEILQSEWADTTVFDLLYNKKGYLIAIFPVFSSRKKYREAWDSYFDLTDYYFKVPPIGAKGAPGIAVRFLRQRKENRRLIESYKEAMVIPSDFLPYPSEERSYVYLASRNGALFADHVEWGTFPKRWSRRDSSMEYEVIAPVYPVYHPTKDNKGADRDYHNAIQGKQFDLREEHETLIIGPGGGMDVLPCAAVTGKVYVTGVSSLEVANVHALRDVAERAGIPFEVVAEVKEVFSDEKALPFDGKQFDRILWNMPIIDFEKERASSRKAAYLTSFYDHLPPRYLRNLAKSLPQIMKFPDGRALLWNKEGLVRVRQNGKETWLKGVPEMLKSAGTFDPRTGSSSSPDNLIVERKPYYSSAYHVTFPKRTKRTTSPGPAPAAGLEEWVMAREMAVAAWGQVGRIRIDSGLEEKRVLVVPKEFSAEGVLAVQQGLAVAFNFDGPVAAGLEELLKRLPEPKGPYAVGTAQSAFLLKEYPKDSLIFVTSRQQLLALIGLEEYLPQPATQALKTTRTCLDLLA